MNCYLQVSLVVLLSLVVLGRTRAAGDADNQCTDNPTVSIKASMNLTCEVLASTLSNKKMKRTCRKDERVSKPCCHSCAKIEGTKEANDENCKDDPNFRSNPVKTFVNCEEYGDSYPAKMKIACKKNKYQMATDLCCKTCGKLMAQ